MFKVLVFTILVGQVFSGQVADKAKQRTQKAYNRAQQFIQQQSPEQTVLESPEKLFKEQQPVLPIPEEPKRQVQQDRSINYKELSFRLILEDLNELKQKVKETEEIAAANSRILELQAEVNSIQKQKQEEVKFYVNMVVAIIGGLITILGAIKGIMVYKGGRRSGTSNS